MIQAIRHRLFLRYYSVFMALYIFNCSVEHPGANAPGVSEELGVNYQESFVELLIEQFLGYENAIAEYEEEESSGASVFKKTLQWQLFTPVTACVLVASPQKTLLQNACLYIQTGAATPCFEIHRPPPNI